MGHIAGKEIYKNLGKKIDGLSCRTPWNANLYELLKAIFSPEEAELAITMPYALSSLDEIQRCTGYEKERLLTLLEGMCFKGLVADLWIHGEYRYMLNCMIVGLFEFIMMKTGGNLNQREMARLFNSYLHEDDTYYSKNFRGAMATKRTVPHEESLSDYCEILDHEKAAYLLENSTSWAIGICSCRHEKHHLHEKKCRVPLDSCISLGFAAEYLSRNNFARKSSREETIDLLGISKEYGLVINADNVKNSIASMCQCCGCCCSALAGISTFGIENAVISSGFMPDFNHETCTGCGRCEKTCPVNAISMQGENTTKKPVVNPAYCLGCGICSLQCTVKAVKLGKSKKRIILPETTFEKIILLSLERGTLQNQLFEDPGRFTHKLMRALIGAFLNLPPVKKALFSDTMRSRFLKTMESGVRRKGREWLLEI